MDRPTNHIHLVKRIDKILRLLFFIGVLIILFLLFNYPSLILTFVILGIILCLGFYIPRHIGWETREKRALRAKTKELEKWGFASRDREGPWINYIDYPLVHETSLSLNKYFYSDWLVIHNGLIIVNPGHNTLVRETKTVSYQLEAPRTYAWDGCTPKRLFYWFALIGTPDWWHKEHAINMLTPQGIRVEKTVFWQIALHASLIHDALYQYLDSIPLAKQEVDELFYQMLLAAKLPKSIADFYLFAVTTFGAKDVLAHDPKENSPYSCDTFSSLIK